MGILATAVKQTPDMFQFIERIWEFASLPRVFPFRFDIHDADNQPLRQLEALRLLERSNPVLERLRNRREKSYWPARCSLSGRRRSCRAAIEWRDHCHWGQSWSAARCSLPDPLMGAGCCRCPAAPAVIALVVF